MKHELLQSVALVAVIALGGCATSGEGKSPGANVNAKATQAPTVKDIIARYRKAIYGGDGTRKQQSMTMKGTLSIEQYGIEAPVVTYSMAPDSNVSNIDIMGSKLSNGCHKSVCWTQQPGGRTTTLTGDAAALQLQQADYSQWEHPERYYTSLEIVAPAEGKESPNNTIKAVKKNGDTDYYHFSKENGLLVAAVIEGETAQGRMQIAMQFKNYKNFDGTTISTEVTQSLPQGSMKLTFSEVSFAPIADDKFAKPE